MKLYVTLTSPYARLARTLVIDKGLAKRVEIIEAKTRTPGSTYYGINPSGRVPFLIDYAGMALEDSQVICAYLDSLDEQPRFHPAADPEWSHRRLEGRARSLCDGVAVWSREVRRPEQERSPGNLEHATGQRQPALHQGPADHLVDRVVTADVLPDHQPFRSRGIE